MTFAALLFFIPACFALNMIPGPSNLLAMNNARNYGLKASLMAGLGRLAAFAGMIFLAASGLAVVLYTSELVFMTIKIAGALYLLSMAYKLWHSPLKIESNRIDSIKMTSQSSLLRQEFFLAAGNPKAILIFTAFLPQFVVPESGELAEQFLLLGSIFLILEWLAIAIYGMAGIYLRRWFSKPASKRLFNRISASILATAAGGILVTGQQS